MWKEKGKIKSLNSAIYIDIEISYNKVELLDLIIDTLPYMNGWHTNEVFPDRDVWQYYLHMPFWFRFALDYKIFSWEGKELDAIKVKDVAELSKFLEMIDELGEQVQNIPPYVKK